MSVIKSDLELHKSQLSDFLSKKYVDQPMLLGFTAVVQSKFHKWIQEDLERLYDAASDLHHGQQSEAQFSLPKLLEALWAQFLHPIVKFYQRQHAEILSRLLASVKSNKKEFKVVEMRKLNEYFVKFTNCVVSFYRKVLEYVMNTYPNPVLTDSLFADLNIPMEPTENSPPSTDFMAQTMYVLYQSLLGLGNITRHSAYIESSYVWPNKSFNHYQKFVSKAHDLKLKQLYVQPLLYYSKCIQLFPQMSDPFNHIGVIYNSLQEKPTAVVWFLRSQFTRDANKTIGKYNMSTVFCKPWLEEEYGGVLKKQAADITTQDLKVMLLRIMGHFFYPGAYKKQLYSDKTSVDFINNTFFHSTPRPFVRNSENILDTLTIMMSFYRTSELELLDEAKTKCGSLLHRFIVNYLKHISRWSPETRDDTGVLTNVRFILAFCHELPSILKFGKEDIVLALYEVINGYLAVDEELKENTLLAFTEAKRPFRFYLFGEDVKFKQFSLIGFKFHDFDDNHLLQKGDAKLLLGLSPADLSEIPSFFDNAAVQRINKDAELGQGNRRQAIRAECARLENALRIQAIVITMKHMFPGRFKVEGEPQSLVLERIDVPATQKQKNIGKKKKDKKEKTERKQKTTSPQPIVPIASTAPSKIAVSLDEIELMIAGHVSTLGKPNSDISTEGGLADMVNAILSEDEGQNDSPKAQNDKSAKTVKVLRPQDEQPSPFHPYNMPQIPQPHFPQIHLPYNLQGYYAPPMGYPYYPYAQPIAPVGQPMGPAGQVGPMRQVQVSQVGAAEMNPQFAPPWQFKLNAPETQGPYQQYMPYPQYQG